MEKKKVPNKIVYVKEKLPQGFIGMNHMANRKFKVIKNHPKNTFYIYRNGNKEQADRTLRHEEIEEHLMRTKGMSYDKKRALSAHDVANLMEDDYDLKVAVKGSSSRRGTTRLHRSL